MIADEYQINTIFVPPAGALYSTAVGSVESPLVDILASVTGAVRQ